MSVVGLLDMMMHIADENAAEVRQKERSRSMNGTQVVTAADLEQQEWEAFKAKLSRRARLLKDGQVVDTIANGSEIDVEEDDIDMLIALIAVLERARESRVKMLTVSEAVRGLQQAKVLSMEFAAPARAQTQRLLKKLREMNRVFEDQHGRWALL